MSCHQGPSARERAWSHAPREQALLLGTRRRAGVAKACTLGRGRRAHALAPVLARVRQPRPWPYRAHTSGALAGAGPHRGHARAEVVRGAPPPLPATGRRGGNRHRPDLGPLDPPIGGGRWGHPVWAVASEDDASAQGIDGARGLPTTGSDGPNNHRCRRRWGTTSNSLCSGWRCHRIDVHGCGCRRPRVTHRHRW
jgi:hypothetical protein